MASTKWVTHIAVIGFHHTAGNQVEYIYPAIEEQERSEYEWELLPFLAMPDGSHHSREDYTYLTLPKNKNTHKNTNTHNTTGDSHFTLNLFGVSCFRQIHTKKLSSELKVGSGSGDHITRSHVQKAVCILSYLPFFGVFRERLSVVTENYFKQYNFSNSDTSVLVAVLDSFNYTYSIHKPLSLLDLHTGLSLQFLVSHYGRKLMVLFKSLFLERSIVVFSAHPVHMACSTVLGLISLLPSNLTLLVPNIGGAAACCDDSLAKFGLPLEVYKRNEMVFPYATLQQMDAINNSNSGFLLGATNVMYQHHPPSSTELVVEASTANIQFRNDVLSHVVSLTSDDRRFIDNVCRKVRSHKDSSEALSNGEGSDEWVLGQFAEYTKCLLHAVSQVPHLFDSEINTDTLDLKSMESYNVLWVKWWMDAHNFSKWRKEFSVQTRRDELHTAAAGLLVEQHGVSSSSEGLLLDDLSHKLSSSSVQLRDSALALTPITDKVVKAADVAVTKVLENANNFSKMFIDDDVEVVDKSDTPYAASLKEQTELRLRSSSMPNLSTTPPTISALKGSFKWAKESGETVVTSGKWLMSNFVGVVRSVSSHNLHTEPNTESDPNSQPINHHNSDTPL